MPKPKKKKPKAVVVSRGPRQTAKFTIIQGDVPEKYKRTRNPRAGSPPTPKMRRALDIVRDVALASLRPLKKKRKARR